MKAGGTGETIAVVGAGPVGCLLSLLLVRRGFRVELFESRPDIRASAIPAGRSINLALSLRGIHALRRVGLEAEILRDAIPMLGRMIHDAQGNCGLSRYGIDDSQFINSISRAELNRALLSRAEGESACRIHFEHRLLDYDVGGRELRFQSPTGPKSVPSSCVIGSDGSASALRKSLQLHAGVEATDELLDYGYKELTIPGRVGAFLMEKNALHIWPRGNFMLIALPNKDGSFTCTLFLPFRGADSFEAFETPHSGPVALRNFFTRHFSDSLRLIPDLEESFVRNPTGRMVTVKATPWNLRGQALLIGDAAHAIVPFFGQGLNCSFEDCTIFDEILEGATSLETAFKDFFHQRKPDTDAIAQLAQENFVEMRDKVGQPRFLLEKEIEKRLMKRFPDRYVSRYALVTFSREPYRWALDAGRAQDKILHELSAGLTSADDLDMNRAERLILEHQGELRHGS